VGITDAECGSDTEASDHAATVLRQLPRHLDRWTATPKDPDPRYNGYSVGKWTDDYTFVVETSGLLPKTWLDHAGRPHSDQLVVEETYHRVAGDTIEYTMKITDPKMYTQSWLALNKLPLHLIAGRFRHSGAALLSQRVRGIQQPGSEAGSSRTPEVAMWSGEREDVGSTPTCRMGRHSRNLPLAVWARLGGSLLRGVLLRWNDYPAGFAHPGVR
jgi:hypothetical protein